jgi:hypothetical protein
MIPVIKFSRLDRRNMAFVRCWRVGLLLPLFFAALSTACGGDSDDEEPDSVEEQRPGPPGCYIPDERRCDCEIAEAACTEDVGMWVEMGCGTCAT